MKHIITNETPYRVSTLRAAGLEAKWSKSEGQPHMVARDPNAKSSHQRNTWWIVDVQMWGTMKKHGIVDGFNSSTLLGNFFHL